jgi:alpha-beta hydrolase superfamily lysophospholipase
MIKKEILLNSGQQKLSGWYWQAENPEAIVILIHGFGEHISRYDHVAEKFTAKDISVLGVDLIGHGSSTGKRGHVDSIKDFYDTIDAMVNYAKQETNDLPFALYGHSMGGNIILNYQLKNAESDFCCILSSSPWLKLKMQPSVVQLFLAKAMNRIYPSLQQSGDLDITQISSVEAVQKDYDNDPMNHDKISVRLFNEIYKHGLFAIEHAAKIKIPVLVAHGDDDGITSANASEEFANNCPNASLKLWSELRHETHNEHNQDEVIDYYVEWVKSKLYS